MRMRVLALLLCATTLSAVEAAARTRSVRRPAPAPAPETRYLDAATRAAKWLETLEQRTGGGIGVPFDASQTFIAPGLPGSAGVGMFYLRMYQVTRDVAYLDKARSIADGVASVRFTAENFDWQGGAVGWGSFLIALYRETHEPQQLARVRSIADTLLGLAIRDNDGGWHWESPSIAATKVFTGMAHGAAGVGMLLLQIHQESPDGRYVEGAEGAYRWARRHTIPLGTQGIGWKRLVTDDYAYHGWCGGSSGMIFFLAELWKATGNDLYRTALIETAEGLVASAITSANGARWRQTSLPSGSSFIVYCHGNASMIGALAFAYAQVGDERYRDLARSAVAWLDATAERPSDSERNWPHVAGSDLHQFGFMVGTASVGHSFLRLYRYDRDPRFLQLAQAAGEFLISNAETPAPGQWRWPIFVEPVPAAYVSDQSYETGWWRGTAGIAMFMLELHEFTSGQEPPAEFSPANP